jgi:hypothetical protein
MSDEQRMSLIEERGLRGILLNGLIDENQIIHELSDIATGLSDLSHFDVDVTRKTHVPSSWGGRALARPSKDDRPKHCNKNARGTASAVVLRGSRQVARAPQDDGFQAESHALRRRIRFGAPGATLRKLHERAPIAADQRLFLGAAPAFNPAFHRDGVGDAKEMITPDKRNRSASGGVTGIGTCLMLGYATGQIIASGCADII